MKLEIKELYRCGECREIHDDEDEARECCMPAVYTLYVCPVCAENHDQAEDAMSCCNADGISCPQCRRDYPSISIDYQAIKIAGHCNACNPLFTIEQQLAVQDLHYQYTGKREHLHE
ncbi:hypothetical protein [Pseudomonas sp. NFX183]|uniref:hypothetical protein n=1 Tax=Pseudomonas sp. NFX183 TaxID=3399573 RepID=UPI003A5BF354